MKSFLTYLHDQVLDRFFKPTNAQMLSSAADQGLDLTKPIPFTFYIAFRDAGDADHVAALLATKGYAITRETDEDDPYPFELEAEIVVLGNESEIERQEKLFKGLVKEFPARFDDYSISYTDEEVSYY